MTEDTSQQKDGHRHLAGLAYAVATLGGKQVRLTGDLFLPDPDHRPAPLVVWLGPLLYHIGAPSLSGLRVVAQELAKQGIALAIPQCRIKAEAADLRATVRDGLDRLAKLRDPDTPTDLSSAAAMAAVEDLCAYLTWIAGNAGTLGLSGEVVLVGSLQGAAVAMHACFASSELGLTCPTPAGIVCYSGGNAWPGLYKPGLLRVLALHNPVDRQMPIGTLRAMAQTDPGFSLLECMEKAQGSIGVRSDELRESAIGRITASVRNWTGGNSGGG